MARGLLSIPDMCTTAHEHLLQTALRRALGFARARGSSRVDSGHLLLALLGEQRSSVPDILGSLGIEPEDVRARMDRSTTDSLASSDAWPYAYDAWAALRRAEEEARRTGHDVVLPEHLLLGLLEAPGRAGEVLRALRIEVSAVRGAVYAQSELEGRNVVTLEATTKRWWSQPKPNVPTPQSRETPTLTVLSNS